MPPSIRSEIDGSPLSRIRERGTGVRALRAHGRPAILLLAAIAVLVAACGGDGDDGSPGATPSPTPPADRAAAMCEALPELLGSVQSTDLTEISGIASSRQNEGVLWAHNDSGGAPSVYAIGPQGEDLGAYDVTGATAIDWEDMVIGPGPEEGVDYLYLADFGDNDAVRMEIVIYRMPEPEVSATGTPAMKKLITAERLVFTYPDRAHDAEVLLVDPVSGDILIITKELTMPPSLVFRAPGGLTPHTAFGLEQVGSLDFAALGAGYVAPADAPALVAGVPHLPTGGDVSPDGGLIAIRTYGLVWIWEREPGSDLADAFANEACQAPSAVEAQGEAIAFDADGLGYTTISEGTNPAINHFDAR